MDSGQKRSRHGVGVCDGHLDTKGWEKVPEWILAESEWSSGMCRSSSGVSLVCDGDKRSDHADSEHHQTLSGGSSGGGGKSEDPACAAQTQAHHPSRSEQVEIQEHLVRFQLQELSALRASVDVQQQQLRLKEVRSLQRVADAEARSLQRVADAEARSLQRVADAEELSL
jgi:hypothetical protein